MSDSFEIRMTRREAELIMVALRCRPATTLSPQDNARHRSLLRRIRDGKQNLLNIQADRRREMAQARRRR